jgi:tripartite ATP-independent transporter DctM subunit
MLVTSKNNKILDIVADYIYKFTCIFLVSLLVLMSITIIYQVIARYVFSAPSNISEEFLKYSLIWLGVSGAGMCFLNNKHLSLPLINEFISDKKQNFLLIFNSLLSIFFGLIMIYSGYLAVDKNIDYITPMLGVPIGLFQVVIFLSGILVVLNQTVYMLTQVGYDKAFFKILLINMGICFLLGILVYSFSQTDFYENLIFDHLEMFSTIVLFSTFIFFLIIGTPIAIGLAFSGIITLAIQIDLFDLLSTIGEKIFGGLDNYGFLALPFFILAGNIMNQGGIARRLINFALILGKRIPGNLWQANILGNILFGSISGSPLAAATAIGGIISPLANEKKYDQAITTAINATSSTAGMLIPPTGVFIVYSLLIGGGASIAGLFLAGYLPGLMLAISSMIMAYYYAKKLGYKGEKSKIDFVELYSVFVKALPSLSLIVVIMYGIIGGIFTAVEASGVAVLYSLILAMIYRTLTFQKMYYILLNTVITSSTIFFLIACSSLMSWSMIFAAIPETITDMLINFSENKNVILAAIVCILIVVGVFMDMTPALLIFTPIFYPIVTQMGVDPIHFGVIIVYTLAIGLVTPPVGPVLFVSCSITNISISKVIRPIFPIFILQILGAFLVVFIPEISLFLPRFFGVIS